ncbi:MAG: alanine--tRNA ligase [Dehalococcoidia bacterium]|nr:alanine--tRNA ligase [Dehalococcoidia bacterium]
MTPSPASRSTPPTTSAEIRQAYLDFFQQRGHKLRASSSLVPEGDPTLLFTTAGMVQMKDYFLGKTKAPAPRMTSCQKCFRTTDIDSVGDSKHLTFFEMLGNFSVGDYFKKEAVAWAWEFVTEVLRLPKERLWATVYLNDDEAFGYWRALGVPEERMRRYGESDNWWGPPGDEGPCGPCSEIHYDFGAEYGCGKPGCGEPSCPCGRFVELWNLVFMQFYQDKQKKRTPLPKPNIDTGAGLERFSAVQQGKRTVYDTDVFQPLLQRIAQMAGTTYGKDPSTGSGQGEIDYAMRVVAEHARGVTFLIADGVAPGNEGRGYVLRRILRRAVRFGKKAGLTSPFVGQIAQAVIERMGRQYPEMARQRESILRVIGEEETRFSETLDTGLELLENQIVPVYAGVIKTVEEWKQKVPILIQASFRQYVGNAPPTPIPVGDKVALFINMFNSEMSSMSRQIEKLLTQSAEDRLIAKTQLYTAVYKQLETIKKEMEKLTIPAPTTTSVSTEQHVLGFLNELLERLTQTASTLSGEVAFVLHDTYGFPPELTEEIAREHGLSVDMAGYEREMERQRERARASAKFTVGERGPVDAYQRFAKSGLRFVGYDTKRHKSKVVGILAGGAPVQGAEKGQEVEVVLQETPFYAEGGGQVGDTGMLRGPRGVIQVTDTQKPLADVIIHRGKVVEGGVAVGDGVDAEVDAARRNDIASNHTGTHLLHAALRKVLGPQVRQAGSLVAAERLRFDFSQLVALAPEELSQVQALVNDKVRQDVPVRYKVLPYAQAVAEGALAFFGEKYGDEVRVVEVDGDPSTGSPKESGVLRTGQAFSTELCGGTHVSRTGVIGLCLVVSESSVGSGMRRVEALTGRAAEAHVQSRLGLLERVARQLQATPDTLDARVKAMQDELDRERKRASALERDVAKRAVESLLADVRQVDGVNVLAARVPASTVEALRETGDWLKAKLKSCVLVMGAVIEEQPRFVVMVTPDLVQKGYHAGDIVKKVAAVAGGGGGGRPELAQAGGKQKDKLDEALRLAPQLVKRS